MATANNQTVSLLNEFEVKENDKKYRMWGSISSIVSLWLNRRFDTKFD